MSIVTNKPGLSRAWVKAVDEEEHRHDGFLSMTELINPVQITLLKKRHFNEIVVDVSDMIWLLLGKSVHYILEQASEADAMTEQRFEIPVLGKQISFCPDRVEKLTTDEMRPYWSGEKPSPYPIKVGQQLWRLKDFKISQTTVYQKLLAGEKEDYQYQVNGYAWALHMLGFTVVEADIEVLMKDWDWLEANVKHTRDYPEWPVAAVPVGLRTMADVQAYLERRVQAYIDAYDKADVDLPECTLDERWATKDRYAVKKIESDNALPRFGNFDTLEQAEAARLARKDASICEVQFRRGESKRCERYCSAKQLCMQYATKIHPPF